MTMDAGTEASLVAAYSALRHVPEGRLAEIRSRGLTAAVTAGTTVFEPNDFCRQFPFPIQGTARVLKVGSLGRDTLLYRLRPGDYCLLSSVALMARWHFAARVVAESDLKAVVIPASLFRTLISESREFSGSVHLAIARRLEVVLDLVEQATYFRLDQRVATLLLTSGPSMAASHQDLADDLGASRENISRVLEGFQDRGWIALGRRQIEVIDPSALETFLDQGTPS